MYTQDEINDDLRFLAQSEIRLKILSELYEQPSNIRGLVKKTKINYSSVSSNVNKQHKTTSTNTHQMLSPNLLKTTQRDERIWRF